MADLLRTAQVVSQKLVENGLQTITMTMQHNSLQLCGNANMIDAILEDGELLKSLESRLKELKSKRSTNRFQLFLDYLQARIPRSSVESDCSENKCQHIFTALALAKV